MSPIHRQKLPLNMVAAVAVGSRKWAGLPLLLLFFLFHVVDSYPNMQVANGGCEECSLQKNNVFKLDQPIYQCKGCCFSRAYPTPLRAKETMMNRKNITSEATCCIAKNSYEVNVNVLKLRNQTECHCSTCLHHQI